jgi:hypothetical protein
LEEYALPETHQQRYDMVSNLVVTYPEQPSLIPTNLGDNIYEVNLSDLKYDYLHFERAWATTNCGLVKVEIIGKGRLSDILNDQFQKPSKKWRRLIGTFAKSIDSNEQSLYIYSENDFVVFNSLKTPFNLLFFS